MRFGRAVDVDAESTVTARRGGRDARCRRRWATLKNVLFISPCGDLEGGAERSVHELMHHLARVGHRVFDAFPEGNPGEKEWLRSELAAAGVVPVGVRGLDWWPDAPNAQLARRAGGQGDLAAIRQIREVIAGNGIDVVVSNTVNVYQGAMAAALEDVRHIWLVHEFPYGEFAYFANRLDFVCEMSDAVLCVAGPLHDCLSEMCGEKPIGTFLPYVDFAGAGVAGCGERAAGAAEGAAGAIATRPIRRVVSVGLMSERKNHLELLRACKLLAERGHEALQVAFIGNCGTDYRRKCDDYIAEAGLQNVEFLGFRERPWSCVGEGDLVVLPSPLETFGCVFAEALAHGVPVVAADNPGFRMIHDRFDAGILYPSGDVEALASTIEQVLANYAEAERSAAETAPRVREAFSVESAYADLITQIESGEHSTSKTRYELYDFHALDDLVQRPEIVHNTGASLDMDEFLYNNAGCDPYYAQWLEEHKVGEFEAQLQRMALLPEMPLFSVIVNAKGRAGFLLATLESVAAQTYNKLECVVTCTSKHEAKNAIRAAGAAGLMASVEQPSDEPLQDAPQVHVLMLDNDLGVSRAIAEGVEAARGEFVCFVECGDLLEADALFEFAKAVSEQPDVDFLYCDEDELASDGTHRLPLFKGGFNHDLLRATNYIGRTLCIRKAVLDQLELGDPRLDEAWRHDLALQASEKARRIHHVPRMLYHRTAATPPEAVGRATSVLAAARRRVATLVGSHRGKGEPPEALPADNAPSSGESVPAAALAVARHLERIGARASVQPLDPERANLAQPPCDRPQFEVRYAVPEGEPLVSIIIPSKDHIELLSRCIDSIEQLSTYRNHEIVVVENNSTQQSTFDYYASVGRRYSNVRVVRWPGAGFSFSQIVNFGRTQAKGDYLLILNNDTEAITPDWIERMLGRCARPEVGAVGAKLYYPDDTVQHAGMAMAVEGATLQFMHLPRECGGYQNLANLQRDASAVCGACLMTSADSYDAVGGLDPELAVEHNDVDFCLKLRRAGKLVVFLPDVELHHYESASRGVAPKPQHFRETGMLMRRWSELFAAGDPYYSPCLQPVFYKVMHWKL